MFRDYIGVELPSTTFATFEQFSSIIFGVLRKGLYTFLHLIIFITKSITIVITDIIFSSLLFFELPF